MYSLVFVTEIYSTKVEKSAYKALINQSNLMNQPIIQKQQLNQPQKRSSWLSCTKANTYFYPILGWSNAAPTHITTILHFLTFIHHCNLAFVSQQRQLNLPTDLSCSKAADSNPSQLISLMLYPSQGPHQWLALPSLSPMAPVIKIRTSYRNMILHTANSCF